MRRLSVGKILTYSSHGCVPAGCEDTRIDVDYVVTEYSCVKLRQGAHCVADELLLIRISASNWQIKMGESAVGCDSRVSGY